MPSGPIPILLIEDNAQDAQLLQEALAENKGLSVALTRAERLSAALKALSSSSFDLILSDLDLPDSKGLDTVASVHERAGGIPIVVLTSNDDPGQALKALQRGAQDYLVKGYLQVYPDLLGRTIRYAIERSRAERELARLASFPEQNPDPIIETDIEGRVTYLNPAARSQFADLAQAGAQHPVLQGLSEIVERFQRDGLRAVAREVACGDRAYEHRISYHPESHLVRSTLVDVTARKQMEARERELSDAIVAAAVTERKRAAELDQAYTALKSTQAMLVQAEKMAAVGQLASGIAHEVKNPLNILLQSINFLEPEMKASGGQRAEVLQVMRDAVTTANKIVRGLLDFSKPAPLELKPTTIGRVIDASLALIQLQLSGLKIQVSKEVAADLPPVLLDDNQMQQVFLNLFMNAIQAMGEQGRLTVRGYLTQLTEAGSGPHTKGVGVGAGIGARASDLFRPGQMALVCEVADTGTGISKDVLPKVFNPFFTTKPPGEGVGLGLPITAAIVEGHRGLIRLESEPGRGTTAILMFPLASDAQAALPPKGAS